jgi:hypothetical protein
MPLTDEQKANLESKLSQGKVNNQEIDARGKQLPEPEMLLLMR